LKIEIMTIFPEIINAVMSESVIGRAAKNGLIEISAVNIRDYAQGVHKKTDDYPYGGGSGMIMLCEPLFKCHEALTQGRHVHTVLMSAQGKLFNQKEARRLLSIGHMILVCGHYEGVDQRFVDECVDEEISIGDYVLTGGEIPAMAVADSVCRLVPGVLACGESYMDESHWNGLLEYPQYTRPEIWHGKKVPDVLLSGHHANISQWRTEMSMKRTKERRPDLLHEYESNTENGIS